MIDAPEGCGWGVHAVASRSLGAQLCAGGDGGAPGRPSSTHGLSHGAANARHMPM
jgi:hypothetical protein